MENIPVCHDFHINKCKFENCRFKHQKKMQMRCIYIISGRECKKGCKQAICCHDYHLGRCTKEYDCQFSHAGEPLGQCLLQYNNYHCFKCTEAPMKNHPKNKLELEFDTEEEESKEVHIEAEIIIKRGNRVKDSEKNNLFEDANKRQSEGNKIDQIKQKQQIHNTDIVHSDGDIILSNNEKECHLFQLKGFCNKKVCEYTHTTPAKLQCIFLEGCTKENPKQSFCKLCAQQLCHNHYLKGFCSKAQQCTYYHVSIPQLCCFKRMKGNQCNFCDKNDLKKEQVDSQSQNSLPQNESQEEETEIVTSDQQLDHQKQTIERKEVLYQKMSKLNQQELLHYEKVLKKIKDSGNFRKTIEKKINKLSSNHEIESFFIQYQSEIMRNQSVDIKSQSVNIRNQSKNIRNQSGDIKNQSVDIMFIVDCTTSMDSWIDAVKMYISDIIDYQQKYFQSSDDVITLTNNLDQENNREIIKFQNTDQEFVLNRRSNLILNTQQNLTFRVSFVGFRDYDDPPVQNLDFTDDITTFKTHVNTVKAIGGGDICEDHFSGLEASTRMSWNSECKIAILITDSPCHGTQYHDMNKKYDDYPSGDLYNRTIEQYIEKLAADNIDLYLLQLNQKCNKMFRVISEVYEKHNTHRKCVQYLNINKPDQSLLNSLQQRVQQSIEVCRQQTVDFDLSRSKFFDFSERSHILDQQLNDQINSEDLKENEMRFNSIHNILEYLSDTNSIQGEDLKIQQLSTVTNYFIQQQVSDKIVTTINWRNPQIKIESGVQQYSISRSDGYFYEDDKFTYSQGYDTTLQKPLLIYKPKSSTNNINSLLAFMEQKAIMNYILKKFCKIFLKLFPERSAETTLLPNNFEIYLLNEGVKLLAQFMPNIKNKEELEEIQSYKLSSEVISSIIHFSFHYSKGTFIMFRNENSDVCLFDLLKVDEDSEKANVNLRTNNKSEKTSPLKKIQEFFNQHECNQICQRLHLIHPLELNESQISAYCQNNINYEMSIKNNLNQQDNAHQWKSESSQKYFCQLCHSWLNKSSVPQRKQNNQNICEQCNITTFSNKSYETCKICNQRFLVLHHWIKMVRGITPECCRTCVQHICLNQVISQAEKLDLI